MMVPPEFEWVKDGVPVWYTPSKQSGTRYGGWVKGTPWPIGGLGDDATWVVSLIEMEPAYRRSTVAAAFLGALEPRTAVPHVPKLSFMKGNSTFVLHTMGNNGHPYRTEEETTDEDLAAAIRNMPEERQAKLLRSIDPDYIEAGNRACRVITNKLNAILDTGEQKGTFGSLELQGLVERILQLRKYPNLSWEMLVQRLEAILDTGEHTAPFPSVALEAFVARLLELRGHPDPGFGVDPKDSAELCALRQAIDDALLWPAPAAEEQGRYELAIEYSGKLAKRFQFIQKAYCDAERELP